MSTFEELERLNAQIDVWIDEEEYDKAIQALPPADDLESRVTTCFHPPHCTQGKYHEWQDILRHPGSRPIPTAHHHDLTRGKKRLDGLWSHLFYAKLLRARIMQQGTDCYLRHLDEVVAYLENHLPAVSNEKTAKLAVLYLLELSAASLSFEIIGFADRACRIMPEHAGMFGKDEKSFPWFYELLAKYNTGIGQFHLGHYRKAIMEFNRVIKEVREAEHAGQEGTAYEKTRLAFFKERHGDSLLYLPAVRYRADVQLKLQLAYHALDTLDEYFQLKEGEVSAYKAVSAKLVEAEAYRQMGMVGDTESWERLRSAYKQLFALEGIRGQLARQRPFRILPKRCFDEPYENVKGRFLDIYVEDHLEWLKQSSPEDDQTQRIRCSEMLQSILVPSYFDTVKYNALSRKGYYQQLTKLLAWLVQAKDEDGKLASIAGKLYDDRGRWLLKQPPESKCQYCESKGIDLRRIDTEHYKWFTDDMLEFFKSNTVKDVLGEEAIKKDKKDFVKRLLELEQRDREDLRIRDLELRYEYYGKGELLEKLRTKEQSNFDYAQELCWGELGNQAESLDLLECNRKTITKRHKESPSYIDRLKSGDYIKIMQDWDKDYLRQLRSPSTHENHKGGFYFMGLQRWNSASPAKGYSVGGGYLLYHLNGENNAVDMGIAIDPGFDFVRNLFHMGFSLDDIDIVLISHAHLDHIRDFESIVMLFSELEKRGKREKRVHVILSLGAYKRLEHIVEDPRFRYFVEPYIIDVDREISDDYFEKGLPEVRFKSVNGNKEHGNSNYIERFRAVFPTEGDPTSGLWAKITPTRAYHDDKTNYSDSFGFLIELNEKIKKPDGEDESVKFGYTGDTRWVYPNMPDPLKREDKHEGRKIEDIAKQYEECDVLLVHLGSLVGKNNNDKFSFTQYDQCGLNVDKKYRCEELVRENDHPYLIGMLRLLSSYYNCVSKAKHTDKPLVLVSEFGEELRGTIRTDFIRRLHGVYRGRLAFLPVDVGLNVQMSKEDSAQDDSHDNRCACKVWCVQCNHFVNIGDAEFELYGTDHALYCVCKTCRKATPVNVLQDRLRQLYEVGRELRTLDAK